MPFSLVEDLLKVMRPEKLQEVESNSPHLLEHSDCTFLSSTRLLPEKDAFTDTVHGSQISGNGMYYRSIRSIASGTRLMVLNLRAGENNMSYVPPSSMH